MNWTFLVNRADSAQTQMLHGPDISAIALADGETLLSVERFSLTANNVTYAAFGDQLGYWHTYPAPARVDGAAWGIVPGWGFANVLRSADPAIAPGTRVYGFVPMASHFVARLQARGDMLIDRSPHRKALAPIYNSFALAQDAGPHDDIRALLQPLLVTSYLIDLYLADNAMMGAQRVILSSASSKTALGLAWLLKQRGGVEVVGLSSPANAAAIGASGCYDRLVGYDDAVRLDDDDRGAIYIDFAGNRALNASVHGLLDDRLLASIAVGGTHHDARATGEKIPGVQMQFFFAPDHARQRIEAWGEADFSARYAQAVMDFAAANRWLTLDHLSAPDQMDAAWQAVLTGTVPPTSGMIITT